MRRSLISLLALCATGAIPQVMAAAETASPPAQYFNWDQYSAQSPQTVYGYESDSYAARNATARNTPPALEINQSSGRVPNVRFNGAVPLFDDDLTPQSPDLPGTGPTSPSGMAASAVNTR